MDLVQNIHRSEAKPAIVYKFSITKINYNKMLLIRLILEEYPKRMEKIASIQQAVVWNKKNTGLNMYQIKPI